MLKIWGAYSRAMSREKESASFSFNRGKQESQDLKFVCRGRKKKVGEKRAVQNKEIKYL